jgi:hypothetical protein
MGSPIPVNREVAMMFLLVCKILSIVWMTILAVVLVVRLNWINFSFNSLQLNSIQDGIGWFWFLAYVISIISWCTIDANSKTRFNLIVPAKRLEADRILHITIFAFLLFAISFYLLPSESIHYDISDRQWYLNKQKGLSMAIIKIFTESSARICVLNSIIKISVLAIAFINSSIYHLLNIINRIDCR